MKLTIVQLLHLVNSPRSLLHASVVPFCAMVFLALPLSAWPSWPESAFAQKEFRFYTFSIPRSPHDLTGQTVIGTVETYTVKNKDTLRDVARYLDLGWHEISTAFPDMDSQSLSVGQVLDIPALWVLPQSIYKGVVINLPEFRLYYFSPQQASSKARTVITVPVGLGRKVKQTPTGAFRVTEKTENPRWVIPDSIRQERLLKGKTEYVIPGGSPDNPLGKHRLRLTHPDIELHGTNEPWTVGRLTSHGCIRLYPEDIAQLYTLVEPWTPATILYQVVKIGVLNEKVYVEVHPDIYHRFADLWEEARRTVRASGLGYRIDDTLLRKAVVEQAGVPVEVTRREKPQQEADILSPALHE